MLGVAQARSNIALVKYWGKRDVAENLPAVPSLSLTLDGLVTRTQVRFEQYPGDDVLILNGKSENGGARARVQKFLDLVRERAGIRGRAQVRSSNSFPTAAGLASSASAFAALAAAAAHAANLKLDDRELSALARRGSGSAARSIFGGFVEMEMEGFAHPLLAPEAWDVRMVIALCGADAKPIGSTEAMNATSARSPYYAGWIDSHPPDMTRARRAVETRDLAVLGEVAESSCLKMHAAAIAAGIVYWNGTTVEVMRTVRNLRDRGAACWFTIDAGPHVKVMSAPPDAEAVETALAAVPGVTRTFLSRPGAGVEVLEGAAE